MKQSSNTVSKWVPHTNVDIMHDPEKDSEVSLKYFQKQVCSSKADLNVETVLRHMISPDQFHKQLDILKSKFPDFEIPDIMRWKISNTSKFMMNPTFTTATSTILNLIVPQDHQTSIRSAELSIANAREIALGLLLELNRAFPNVMSVLQMLKIPSPDKVVDSLLPVIGERLSFIELKSVSLTMQTSAVKLSSILFETDIQLQSFSDRFVFPLEWAKDCKVHASILQPFSEENRAVGTCVTFLNETPMGISLDASFESSSVVEGSVLHLKPCFIQTHLKGKQILNLLSYVVSNCKVFGSKFLQEIHELYLFDFENLGLKAFRIEQNNKGIPTGFYLELLFKEIEIMQHITFRNGMVELKYSAKNELILTCKASIVAFGMPEFFLQFTLPTSQSEGILLIDNPGETLTLPRFLTAIGWNSLIDHIPSFLKTSHFGLTKLCLRLKLNEKKTFISGANVSLQVSECNFESELSLSQLTVNCTFEINRSDRYDSSFSLSGTIGSHGKSMHVSLKYDRGSNELQGEGHINIHNEINVSEVMKLFDIEIAPDRKQRYHTLIKQMNQMLAVVKTCNIDRDAGDAGVVVQANFVLGIEESTHGFSVDLKYIGINMNSTLNSETFTIGDFQVEYRKKVTDDGIIVIGRIICILQAKGSGESITLEVKLDKEKAITAHVYAGPDGRTFTLRSLLDIVNCTVPELPQIPEIPHFFDIGLKSGTMSFSMNPDFNITSFSLTILVPPWEASKEPSITLQCLHFTLNWEKGKIPSLESSLSANIHVGDHIIDMKGRLDKTGVYLNISTQCVVDYDAMLEHLPPPPSAVTVPCRIPQDVELPSVFLEVKKFTIELNEDRVFIFFDGTLKRQWQIKFGSSYINIMSAGGKLQINKQFYHSAAYKAEIYGSLDIGKLNVHLSLHLGTDFMSILVGEIQPSDASFSQIGNYLMETQGSLTSVSNLTPKKVDAMTSSSTALALFDIPSKRFYLFGKLQDWGCAMLFVGQFEGNEGIRFAFLLEIHENFRFKLLDDDLEYLDKHIRLKHVTALISAVEHCTFSEVLNSYNIILPQQYENLQYTGYNLCTKTSAEEQVLKQGLTFVAELDLVSCKECSSVIGRLYDIAEELNVSSISVALTATKEASTCVYPIFTLKTFLTDLKLIEELHFKNIDFRLEVPRTSKPHLYLSGDVSFQPDDFDLLSFKGTLDIDMERASFKVSKPSQCEIQKPGNMLVSLNKLELKLEYNFVTREIPFLEVEGEISALKGAAEIGAIVLFQKAKFKLFLIEIRKEFTLSRLLNAIGFKWPFVKENKPIETHEKEERSMLDFGISNGMVYYAKKGIKYKDKEYKEGGHLQMEIRFCKIHFLVGGDICFKSFPPTLKIWGQPRQKIPLLRFIELSDDGFIHGPKLELQLTGYFGTISIIVGITFFGKKYLRFIGKLSFEFPLLAFTGEISYDGNIGFIERPTIAVTWGVLPPNIGLQSVKLPIVRKIPCNFIGALKQIAKWIGKALAGLIQWDFSVELKLGTNPNPDKYYLQLVIHGAVHFYIRSQEVEFKVPLPKLPINIPKIKSFSLKDIPKMIAELIWSSARSIAYEFYVYIKNIFPTIFKAVVDTGKAAATKVKHAIESVKSGLGKCFKLLFGSSVLIYDENGPLAYICGGKQGKPFENEGLVCNIFGCLVGLEAVQEMSADVVSNIRSFEESGNDEYQIENDDFIEDLDQAQLGLQQNLQDLKKEILQVGDISCEICDEALIVTWKMKNNKLNDDKGDIEHCVDIMVTTLEDNKVIENISHKVFKGKERKLECSTSEFEDGKPLFVITGVQAQITMTVYALPDTENHESASICEQKENFKNRGRRKEITLYGDVHYETHFSNPIFDEFLPTVTAKFDCFKRCITCKVNKYPESQCQYCLLQIVDKNNPTATIAESNLLTKLHHDSSEVCLPLPECFKLPEYSNGPYHVRALGIISSTQSTKNFSFSQEKIDRLLPPGIPMIEFEHIDTDKEVYLMSQGKKYNTVIVKWHPSPDEGNLVKYYWQLVIIESDVISEQQIVKDVLLPQSLTKQSIEKIEDFYELRVPFQDICKEMSQRLLQGIALQFRVYACFKKGTGNKLESVPSKGPIFHILNSPKNITCKFEDRFPGFSAKWSHTDYASTYTLVFKDTCNVNTEPIYENISALESIVSQESELEHRYVFSEKLLNNTTDLPLSPIYSLEIFSVGDIDGSEYLTSPQPAILKEQFFQPINVQLKYNQENDCLSVLANVHLGHQFSVHIFVKQCRTLNIKKCELLERMEKATGKSKSLKHGPYSARKVSVELESDSDEQNKQYIASQENNYSEKSSEEDAATQESVELDEELKKQDIAIQDQNYSKKPAGEEDAATEELDSSSEAPDRYNYARKELYSTSEHNNITSPELDEISDEQDVTSSEVDLANEEQATKNTVDHFMWETETLCDEYPTECIASGYFTSSNEWACCIFEEENWLDSVLPGESLVVWVTGNIKDEDKEIMAYGISNTLRVISSVTLLKSTVCKYRNGSIDMLSMTCDVRGKEMVYHYGVRDINGMILFQSKTTKLQATMQVSSITLNIAPLSYIEFQCFVRVPAKNGEISGALSKETHMYQCIGAPRSLVGFQQIVYDSRLLCELLCYKSCSAAIFSIHINTVEEPLVDLHVHSLHNDTITKSFPQDIPPDAKRRFLIGATTGKLCVNKKSCMVLLHY